jgi:hypothetical protein
MNARNLCIFNSDGVFGNDSLRPFRTVEIEIGDRIRRITVDSALEPGSLFFRQHTNNDHHPMVFALEAAILATSFITATSKIA